MQKQKHNAFSLIELLVVIALIGIFSAFALPNVTKWLTDREVKKEVYDFVAEINEYKSKVTSGEYALGMIYFDAPSSQNAFIKKYYMSTEDYVINYSGKNANNQTCSSNVSKQKYQLVTNYTYTSDKILQWPKTHLCISKNGSKIGTLNFKNPDTGLRGLGAIVFCSAANSKNSGSTKCNINNKIDHRYMITWNRFVNITVYKFNFKKNKWCTGKACRSWSEFK